MHARNAVVLGVIAVLVSLTGGGGARASTPITGTQSSDATLLPNNPHGE